MLVRQSVSRRAAGCAQGRVGAAQGWTVLSGDPYNLTIEAAGNVQHPPFPSNVSLELPPPYPSTSFVAWVIGYYLLADPNGAAPEPRAGITAEWHRAPPPSHPQRSRTHSSNVALTDQHPRQSPAGRPPCFTVVGAPFLDERDGINESASPGLVLAPQ
jgi:hypothetical protein